VYRERKRIEPHPSEVYHEMAGAAAIAAGRARGIEAVRGKCGEQR